MGARGDGGDGAVGGWRGGARLARGRGGGEGWDARTRARGKSASDFSFILYFSNASDSLKVQDTSPEYQPSRSSTVDIILKLLSRKLCIVL